MSRENKSFEKECQLDNISGPIFDPQRPDDFDAAFNSVLNTLILDLATIINNEDIVSNFLKTDKIYFETILERFKNNFIFDEYNNADFFKKFDKVFK